jgi:putative DNA primase/helicase
MNAADATAEFLSAMEGAGVRPVEPIAQALMGGNLIRFRADGDKPGRKNGWAVLHLDGTPAGAFGWYAAGVRERWRANDADAFSPADREARRRAWAEASRRRAAETRQAHERVAGQAEALWSAADPACAAHGYLSRKRLDGSGLRQVGGLLLVPMHDLDGRLWNVQRIKQDGGKFFLKGGRTKGLLHLTGPIGKTVCVGEGWATMAAVREATGHSVAATFSGENLEPVARLLRQRWPCVDMVICADDDPHLVHHPMIRKNLGLEYARAAAAAVGARLAVPQREGC